MIKQSDYMADGRGSVPHSEHRLFILPSGAKGIEDMITSGHSGLATNTLPLRDSTGLSPDFPHLQLRHDGVTL